MEESLITKKEACDKLKVTLLTINRMIKEGRIEAFKIGGIVRINEASLVEMLRANKIKIEV